MHSPTRTRRAPWREALGVALLGFIAVGCLGGQTGGEFRDEDPTFPAPTPPSTPDRGEVASCRDHAEPIALADTSRLGFSGADVLAFTLGEHQSPLTWNPRSVVSFGPEQGTSAIWLTIAYQGGGVRFVKSELVPGSGGAGAEPAMGCRADRIEVDVLVTLRTAGGALDESFGATLSAQTPGHATLSRALAIDALSGAFTAYPPAGYTATTLSVFADFQGSSFTGTLTGSAESRTGDGPDDTASSTFVNYASWP